MMNRVKKSWFGLLSTQVLVSFMLLPAALLLVISESSQAGETENFYNSHESGWHWYNDPELKKNEDTSSSEQSNPLSGEQALTETQQKDPIAAMEDIRKSLKTALYAAILNPTEENVEHYMSLQKEVLIQSSRFQSAWKEALLSNPQLDYSLIHPVNQVGSEVYQDQQRIQEDQAIALLAKQYGLFFFYRSNCPYCQRFSPILKSFSQKYGINVLPITTNGMTLPEFPNSRVDQGQAEKFHVTVEPALFTVNPSTHQAIPVSYGLLTESELRERILEIAKRLTTTTDQETMRGGR